MEYDRNKRKKPMRCLSDDVVLASQWDHTKNRGINLKDVSCGSKKIVWWVCEKGHEWKARIQDRIRGNNCPYCSGRVPVVGENDLETLNPTLAAEWNYDKNDGLLPKEVSCGSGKKVWWVCKKGHEWMACVCHRSQGDGCPFCSGRKAIRGETDLATVNPELASEWDSEKNAPLSPQDVSAHSGKTVGWKCRFGHKWDAHIYSRTNGEGCPFCAGQRPVSGVTDLGTVNPQLAAEWNNSKNGSLFPRDVTEKSNKRVFWKCKKGHEWSARINDRSKGNGCPYCAGRRPIVGETDLETVNPKLAAEWDYSKNGTKTPRDFTAYSNKKMVWKCKEGHEWLASIHRRSEGTGCPFCEGQRAIAGETDLETVNPLLAAQWHKEKNGNLTPRNVCPNSIKKVWWRCERGHEWESTVNNRTKGNGCPYCSGRKPIVGETDLLTTNPILAKEWNAEKNGNITPRDVSAYSNKKMWWICNSGHEWEATVNSRSVGNGCPYCAGKKPVPGETDLMTLNPEIAEEWHPEMNGALKPCSVTEKSGKVVWWLCENGHAWKARISHRVGGSGCPYCQKIKKTGKRLI